MNKSIKLSFCIISVFAVLNLTGCGPTTTPSANPNSDTQNSKINNTSEPQKKSFSVALSNSFIGNNWRVQMLQNVEGEINKYKEAGLVNDYIVANANNNAAEQISQIEQIIQKKPDLLLVDAASSDALNPVIKKAQEAGITVVSFDNIVTEPQVTKVSVDYREYGKIGAEWLAKTLNGKGNIAVMRGVVGQPVDAEINEGMKGVLDTYPDIKVAKEIFANWDQAASQTKMSTYLATGQKIDGVFTQGGMSYGVVKAMENAKHPLVPIVAGGTVSFIKYWDEHKADGFKATLVASPPALGGFALHVGMMKLQGEKVPNTVIQPLQIITEKDDLTKFTSQPDANRFDIKWDYGQVKEIVAKQIK